MMEWLLLPVIGLVAGIIGALLGLGGGVIVVPTLLFFGTTLSVLSGITPQSAVGISLVVMIVTGLSSTLAYLKNKTVDVKSGLIFFAGSGPGAIVGSLVNKQLTIDSFQLYFGIFLLFLAFILFIRKYLKPVTFFQDPKHERTFTDPFGKKFTYGFPAYAGVAIAFLVGFASGLFGIGGGSVMVPVMVIAFLFPPHVAVATSMLMVFLSSIVGSVTHISLGNVNWLYVLALAPGAWFGAKAGAWLNVRIKSEMLIVIFRIVLVLLGVRSIMEGM